MINEPAGNMIYSFGFDFKSTDINKIKNNKGNPEKFSVLLIRRSFVDANSGILVNIKSIFGLSDTIDKDDPNKE
jgi:hypothetical protein